MSGRSRWGAGGTWGGQAQLGSQGSTKTQNEALRRVEGPHFAIDTDPAPFSAPPSA